MTPIEAGYAMLAKNNVKISSAEQEQLDSMRFQWSKMMSHSAEMGTHLVKIQPDFNSQLVESVKVFGIDQKAFLSDYNIKGPMVDGIVPAEASDRLTVFQARFDELYKKYVTYNGGEALFGLTQTEYPDLMVVKKELNLLNHVSNQAFKHGPNQASKRVSNQALLNQPSVAVSSQVKLCPRGWAARPSRGRQEHRGRQGCTEAPN